MIPGEWFIEDVQIPWVVSASYSEGKIELECAAFKDGNDDPREVIDNVLTYMSFPASSDEDLTNGMIPQSLFYSEPLYITDGYEVFRGFVSAPIFKEDEYSNDYIAFKITILLWVETDASTGITELADGDECTYDDDWEEGYETYNPPTQPKIIETPAVQTVKKTVKKATSKKSYLFINRG